MTQQTLIPCTAPRTRADGSIDIAYYMARGRRVRSDAAFQAGGFLRNWLGTRLRRLAKARLLTADPGRAADRAVTTHAAAGAR